jgi:hypothetical protein
VDVLPGLGPKFPNADVGQYAGLLLLLFLWISDGFGDVYESTICIYEQKLII